jgi:hypothetical protein
MGYKRVWTELIEKSDTSFFWVKNPYPGRLVIIFKMIYTNSYINGVMIVWISKSYEKGDLVIVSYGRSDDA